MNQNSQYGNSFIGGGDRNILEGLASSSVIVGGSCNILCSTASFIGGGGCNIVDINAECSIIGGGWTNKMCGTASGILGGVGNVIHPGANGSAIVGGLENGIAPDSPVNFIGAPYNSTIGNYCTPGSQPAIYSDIVGGHDNCIDTSVSPGSDVVGSFIAGGGNNNIFNSACYSSVGGGQGNTVVAGACYSSVIGGQNNTVQHNWASIAGSGVTSVMDCAVHANNFVGQNIPAGNPLSCAPPTGLPAGAFYYINVGGFCQLWIV